MKAFYYFSAFLLAAGGWHLILFSFSFPTPYFFFGLILGLVVLQVGVAIGMSRLAIFCLYIIAKKAERIGNHEVSMNLTKEIDDMKKKYNEDIWTVWFYTYPFWNVFNTKCTASAFISSVFGSLMVIDGVLSTLKGTHRGLYGL